MQIILPPGLNLESRPAYAVSAPTGRRIVAAGGAARPPCGPTRNPWKEGEEIVSHPFFLFAPAGRRGLGSDESTSVPGDYPQTPRGCIAPTLRSFRPGGAKGFLGSDERTPVSGDSSAPRGGCVERRSFPRVAHRPPCSGRCSTRGYTPPPRRGEKRQPQVRDSRPAAMWRTQ
jgi:hypothetical protein